MTEESVCSLKTCKCNNGVGHAGEDCTVHDMPLCKECNAGYHLDDGFCKENLCRCKYGTPETLQNCEINNSLKWTMQIDLDVSLSIVRGSFHMR